LKNLSPSQKTLRHPWCPKLVTGLIGHSLKNLGTSQKTLCPTWCSTLVTSLGKTVRGIVFFDKQSWCDVDPEIIIDEFFKKKRRLNFIF